MTFLILIFVSIGLSQAYAEDTKKGSESAGKKKERPLGGGVQVWDERVFDIEDVVPPDKTKEGRYYDYSRQRSVPVREKALETCSVYKDTNREKWKDCFRTETDAAYRRVEEQRDAVEKRQSQPRVEGGNPLLPEALKRGPARDEIYRFEEEDED